MGALFDRPVVMFGLLALVVLLFGANRLPDLSRNLGRSLRILKAETEHLRSDHDEETAALDAGRTGSSEQVLAPAAAQTPEPTSSPRS